MTSYYLQVGMVENKDYFQLIFNLYSRTGLRRSSTCFSKFVSLCLLYPLLIIMYLMVIYNFRYKHSDIFDIAQVISSISTFGNVQDKLVNILPTYTTYIIFSWSTGKRLF